MDLEILHKKLSRLRSLGFWPMKTKANHFNFLVVTIDKNIRPEMKEFLHKKIIHLEFEDDQNIDSIPLERLALLDAVGVAHKVKGHLRLAVWEVVKPNG